jgi:hypothetical protein
MSDRSIKDAVMKLSGVNLDQITIVSADVVSVNEAARTCVVNTTGSKDNVQLESVQLMAALDDGLLFIPVIDSTVLVAYSAYNRSFICLYSAISKVLFITGNSIIQLIDGKITFNDGSYGGMVEVGNLVIKLNNLENVVNDFASKFNSHTHALALTSGTGTSAPTTVPETTVLTATQRADLENLKVVHGK